MPFSCFFGRMSILSAILKGVSAPLCKREVNELIYLTVDEEDIITTEKHSFYVKDRGFVSAGKLKPGDEVLLSDGTTAKIRKVEEHHLETPVCVYNFEVEELHTYLVGTKGIVVHNDCAEPVPEGESQSIWSPSKNKNSLWIKGKLKTHFEKHGSEVGANTSAEYSKMALEFGTKQSPNIIQAENGSFLYRFDPTTNEIFVGTVSGGKIKTYYKWDGVERTYEKCCKVLLR